MIARAINTGVPSSPPLSALADPGVNLFARADDVASSAAHAESNAVPAASINTRRMVIRSLKKAGYRSESSKRRITIPRHDESQIRHGAETAVEHCRAIVARADPFGHIRGPFRISAAARCSRMLDATNTELHPMHQTRALLTGLALVSFGALAVSCVEKDVFAPEPQVRSLTVFPNPATVRVDETLVMVVTMDADSAADHSLIWSSADPRRVAVSDNGILTGMSVGSGVV